MSPSRRSVAILLLALLALGQLPLAARNPAAAAPPLDAPAPAHAEPGQLLIVFEAGTGDAEQEAVEVAAEPVVRYTQPNYIYTLDRSPDDGGFDQLWGLDNTVQGGGGGDADIDTPEAWEITTGSRSIVVGVVDSGILYDHPDLAANMWTAPACWSVKGCGAGTHGYRNSPGDPDGSACDPIDENSHGTHVAGTIGAVGDNGTGVVGVNWSVQLMALRAFNGGGAGNTAGAIDVIDYAIKAKQAGTNLRALNNSWTGVTHDQALLDQIDAANAEGIVFVAAAGNGGADRLGDNNATSPVYPANYGVAPYNRPNVIAVAATDRGENLASFSNYGGTTVHLGAPGVDTYSTVLNDGYGSRSGTSMAAPHVAGSAALLLSVPGLSDLGPAALRARLLRCGESIASLDGLTISGKRLNIDRAIRGAGGGAPPPPPNPPPAIDTLSPASGLVGGDRFTLKVDGGNFVTTSIVRWNGANQPTSYVSATQLAATIDAALVTSSGTANITVFNPVPGGGSSESHPFTIEKIGQSITFAALADRTYGDPSFTVSATASSGLSVSFTAGPTAVCVPVGGNGATIALVGAGECTVVAQQPGDARYRAAPGVARTFRVATPRCAAPFGDVPASNPACPAVANLAARGIVRGYATSPTSFGPGDGVRRAEDAAMIVRALGWGGGHWSPCFRRLRPPRRRAARRRAHPRQCLRRPGR